MISSSELSAESPLILEKKRWKEAQTPGSPGKSQKPAVAFGHFS